MRVLVTGSRDLTDRKLVWDALMPYGSGHWTLIVGDCPTGADLFARAHFRGSRMRVFTADWATHGKAAGPKRNQAMVDSGADVCLAFLKAGLACRGTRDCASRAELAGIPVRWFMDFTEVSP